MLLLLTINWTCFKCGGILAFIVLIAISVARSNGNAKMPQDMAGIAMVVMSGLCATICIVDLYVSASNVSAVSGSHSV